ncbi:MAG: tagG [Neobacillus sp.]|jgi:ABC-type polysaccharide/polyol phosphate export permease|nr:tagG [Neobacillus sp.]
MFNFLKGFRSFIFDLLKSKELIFSLARNDLKSRFAGSYLGIFWTIIQPLVTILVFWFVFEVGFKSAPINDVPFILWFIPAFLSWSFFSDAISTSTNTMYEYSYLVKKVKFRVSVLPTVKILSALFIHLFFICFIVVMFSIYGQPFKVQYLQVIYYCGATIILLTGLSWLLSSLAPFLKDLTQFIGVLLQIGFWITPIFWSAEGISPKILMFMKLNPMFYITRGYRDCFIDGIWFWQRGNTNIYFWVITAICFISGAIVFQKLRPHFADVL